MKAEKSKGKNRQLKLVSTDSLRGYLKNARTHSEAQIAPNMAFLCVFLRSKSQTVAKTA
jgi:hypothetical protein